MRGGLSFEPQVEFPDDPHEAASIYLGVMAYPREGAGQIGAPGQHFAMALQDYRLWRIQKIKGLAFVREASGDPHYMGPKKRSFEGVVERGLRQIDRRMAAYDFYASQLVTAFFRLRQLGALAIREGRANEAFHINAVGEPAPARAELWQKSTPSAHKMIRDSSDHWLDRLAINETGRAADAKQKVKDAYRRELVPSVAVLHLAHGFAEAAHDMEARFGGLGNRDLWLTLYELAEYWIWDAIERAETWRLTSAFPGGLPLTAADMIELVWRKP
ncbi:MAG: hypothetical protein ACT4OF_10350 [Caulobacteraceae bacterium]